MRNFDTWEADKYFENTPVYFRSYPRRPDSTNRICYTDMHSTPNESIHTLFLSQPCGYISTLSWLFQQLHAIKTLYFNLPCDRSYIALYPFNVHDFVKFLQEEAIGLEKLVFTNEGFIDNEIGISDPSLGLGLHLFTHLTSLSIPASYLLGYDLTEPVLIGTVRPSLPPSLVELEIFYDYDCDVFLYSDEQRSASRPNWLFDLLANKNESTPNLSRIRLISCEWRPGQDERRTWDGDYEVHIDDWDVSRKKMAWKPPMELIEVFEAAMVSFSVFLHSERKYKWVIKGACWFNDSWEDSWKTIMLARDSKMTTQERKMDASRNTGTKGTDGWRPTLSLREMTRMSKPKIRSRCEIYMLDSYHVSKTQL